jgi:Leucine-rich repeat (LRR) protein
MDQFGQIVVPIFYNVDPSDVRKQIGSFKRAFDHHERAFKKEKDKVLQWREALRRVGSISGSDSRNRDESVLIEKIVQDVSDKLFSESSKEDNKLVGMSYHMEQMNSSLWCNDGSEEVLMLGIWGMGGIGKTAISTALYNRYSRHYDGSCYVSNVKDIFRKHGPSFLQERLLSEIFRDKNLNIRTLNENFNVIKERLSRKKVFIVLDDVDGVKQLETLAGKHEWFGPGSRIIITTRDQRLLITHGVNYLYDVMSLRDNEAFQLFSQYAFKQDKPTPDYLELSSQFVSYAKGHPLALKILGSFLYRKRINEWVSELDKLKKIPNAEIQDVLRISFDGLDDKQKDIFLDIACFFKGEDKDFLIDIWESCGFFPETGLRVLAEKSLIITNEVNYLEMHDLLCEMGKEVVRQESTKEPGERSRLWLFEDARHVFKHNTGTKAVEGIFLEICDMEELQLTREAFRKMHNLRLLKIYNNFWTDKTNKVHLPHGLEGLSDELRYLHWELYPLKCLPCNFQPENLVELIMPCSNLEQPWEATKSMKNLKRLILRCSESLEDIGDLSLARNLEFIDLEGCISLQVIHPSIQYLNKLKKLNLRFCKNLRSPPETAGLVSLEYLTISGCSKITELPDNLGKLSSLVVLEGKKIGINRFPSSVSDLRSLEKMLLSGCKGKDSAGLLLPPLRGLHSLKELKLKDFNMKEFPEGLASLSSLENLDLSGNSFERIDLSLGPLTNLSELKLNECKMLQSISNLPLNIRRLQAHNCSSLEKVTVSIFKRSLFTTKNSFVFTNCFNLKHISLRNIMIGLLERLQDLIAAIKEEVCLSLIYFSYIRLNILSQDHVT